jgi:hypothetical protein
MMFEKPDRERRRMAKVALADARASDTNWS